MPDLDPLSLLHGRDPLLNIPSRAKLLSQVEIPPAASMTTIRSIIEAEAIRQMRFLYAEIQQREGVLEIEARPAMKALDRR